MEVYPMLLRPPMKWWLLSLSLLALAVPLAAQPDISVLKGGPSQANVGTVIASADVGTRKSGPDTAGAGAPIAYDITMINFGPTASQVSMHDTLPAEVRFLSIAQTSGVPYSCSTPAVGSTGTILCSTTAT